MKVLYLQSISKVSCWGIEMSDDFLVVQFGKIPRLAFGGNDVVVVVVVWCFCQLCILCRTRVSPNLCSCSQNDVVGCPCVGRILLFRFVQVCVVVMEMQFLLVQH